MGLVQDWITFELAVRIRNSNVYSDISEAGKKKLRFASSLLFAFLIFALLVYSTIIIASAHKEGNHGYAFIYD